MLIGWYRFRKPVNCIQDDTWLCGWFIVRSFEDQTQRLFWFKWLSELLIKLMCLCVLCMRRLGVWPECAAAMEMYQKWLRFFFILHALFIWTLLHALSEPDQLSALCQRSPLAQPNVTRVTMDTSLCLRLGRRGACTSHRSDWEWTGWVMMSVKTCFLYQGW